MTINAVNKSLTILASLDGKLYSEFPQGTVSPTGTLIASADFEDGNTDPGVGWTAGTVSGGTLTVSVDTGLTYNGSVGSIRGQYPYPSNNSHCFLSCQAISAENVSEVYIEFWAKMPSAYKGGLKFCKVFGKTTSGYANCTFGLDFTGIDNGAMLGVGSGDGSTTTNDAVVYYKFAGGHSLGRNSGLSGFSIATPQNAAFASTDWGTDWHHFKFRVKFNTGTTALNEVNDGEFDVWIDGLKYLTVRGCFNRHYSNDTIDSIGFFNYAQTNDDVFEVWYDDIKISTGGFV